MLSREGTVRRLRVTVVEERVQIWKVVQIGGLTRLVCFTGDREKCVVNALINFEHM